MILKRCVGVLALLLVYPVLCQAASFSADMVETRRGRTDTGQFYLLDHQYRMDMTEKGRPLTVLVDEKAGKTRVIVPSESVFVEMDNSDMQSLMNNPFAAYRFMVDKYEMQTGGRETVGGMPCEKQVFTIQGKEVMTAWIAEDYKFPVKLENKMNGRLLELKNVKPGGVTPDRFAIPAEYKKVAAMPLDPPEWAGDIAGAPVMTPPFETTLTQGQIVRIKPVRNFHINIRARSQEGLKGSFSATAFKDGRPLKRVTAFAGGGRKVQKETPAEADEIVVRAASGSVTINADLVEAPEKTSPAASTQISSGADRMVLILDASGSMWGQIDGKAKIAIAKEVLTELVGELPRDLQVGLTVYGHRRKGDCADIEMVAPVKALDAAGLTSRIAAISPKGKTPIGASLLQVAETLKGQPGNKVIVLVTDGLESCDRDPCQIARQLADAGVVTKIHIVGFDLKGDALAQLKCIAEPSGGLLVAAANAEELKSALTDVVTATLPHNLIVKAVDPNGKSLFVSVRVSQAERTVAKSAGGTLRYALPAGKYEVEVRYSPLDQTIVLNDVAVDETHLTEKEVIFAQSKLTLKSLDGDNKALYSSAAVYKAGTDRMLEKSNASKHVFTLPPGVYDVKVTHAPTKTEQWLKNLQTSAGGDLIKEVVFAKCELEIDTVDGNNKALYSSAAVYVAGTDETVKKHNGSRHKFTLLPGTYDAKVTCNSIKKDKWLRNISLQANDRVRRQVAFALGDIKISAYDATGKKLYLGVTVYPAGGRKKIHRATGGSPSFTLAPGAYDFHVNASQIKQEKWLRGVTIEDGDDKKQKVQF